MEDCSFNNWGGDDLGNFKLEKSLLQKQRFNTVEDIDRNVRIRKVIEIIIEERVQWNIEAKKDIESLGENQ